jgi:hypothetical protein
MSFFRTAAGAALSVLVLSACGNAEGPAAAPADAPTPASSTAPAANIRVPASNDLMAEDSVEGARAFLFHYFDLLGYSLQTGETGVLEEHLAGAEAERKRAEGAVALYRDGGWILGGQPKAKNVLVTSPGDAAPGSEVTALVPVNTGVYTAFDADGEVLEHRPFDADGTIYSAVVRYADGAWRLVSLEETPGAVLPE